jgi:hypothetical protein
MVAEAEMVDQLSQALAMGLARRSEQLSYIPAAWTRYEQQGFVAAEPFAGGYGPPYVVTLTAAGQQALIPKK